MEKKGHHIGGEKGAGRRGDRKGWETRSKREKEEGEKGIRAKRKYTKKGKHGIRKR